MFLFFPDDRIEKIEDAILTKTSQYLLLTSQMDKYVNYICSW